MIVAAVKLRSERQSTIQNNFLGGLKSCFGISMADVLSKLATACRCRGLDGSGPPKTTFEEPDIVF